MTVMHHAKAFRAAWSAETERRRTNQRRWVETEFLPAALEVAETPPSPAGRAILWIIVAAAASSLAWAFLSKVDTVAVAQGRLVPVGRLRSVEAADQGVIRMIGVREGQHVNAGDVLIELDPTVASADADSAQTEFATAALTRARDNALLAYAAGRDARFKAPAGVDPAAADAERQLVAARIAEFNARQASLNQRRVGAEATVGASQAQIVKLERSLPLIRQQLESQLELETQGYGARLKRLQQEQALITAEQDLVAERGRIAEARAQVASIEHDVAQGRQEFIQKAAEERSQAESVVSTRGDQVRKAEQRQSLQRLTAPVSGIVQEVSVTTLGEVSEVGKSLVTIVPDGEARVVEALMLNRDAGFVKRGDPVVVKLEAYPFTRYGALKGVVEHVSPDATVDQQRGLVFPVRVRLTKAALTIDGQAAQISPGMAVSAEIVTGRRRVIDYLWSPVSRSVREAGRER